MSAQTRDRMAEIRTRLEKATPGPWQNNGAHTTDVWGWDDRYITTAGDNLDADLIANAPSDLAYLLGGVTRLEAELAASQADALMLSVEAARLREAMGNLIDEHEQSDEPGYYAVHVSDFDAAVRALAAPSPAVERARALLALGEATLALQRAKEAKAKAGRMTIRFSEEGRAAFADDQRRYDAILTTLFEAEKAFYVALRAIESRSVAENGAQS